MARKITFVASELTMGDGQNHATMDFYEGSKHPWLSITIPELKRRGFEVEVVSWKDESINWQGRNVLIGPIWVYSKEPERFYTWLNKLDAENAKVVNSTDFIRWNSNKSYLHELESIGVRTIPSYIIHDRFDIKFEDAVRRAEDVFGTRDLVFKGLVGSAGTSFGRLSGNNYAETSKHYGELMAENMGCIVQPYMPEIKTAGEYSFVFYGNSLSHCFLKKPSAQSDLVQANYGGSSQHIDLRELQDNSEVLQAKEAAIEAFEKMQDYLAGKGISQPQYCRIDGLFIKGQFYIMEVEGIEPYMEMEQAAAFTNTPPVVRYAKTVAKEFGKNIDVSK